MSIRWYRGALCPGFVWGTLSAHWSANERAPFVPRLVTPPEILHFRSRSKRVRFVHSSPIPLQKDYGSIKTSWTKRHALLRHNVHLETGPNRRSHSDVEKASIHNSTPAPKMDYTIRPFQRGNVEIVIYIRVR
jgi:hypothetical protein